MLLYHQFKLSIALAAVLSSCNGNVQNGKDSEIRLLQVDDVEDPNDSSGPIGPIKIDVDPCCDPSLLRGDAGFRDPIKEVSFFCDDQQVVCCPDGKWNCAECIGDNGQKVLATGEVCESKCCDPAFRNSVGFTLPGNTGSTDVFCGGLPVCCLNGEWSCASSLSGGQCVGRDSGLAVPATGRVCVEKCCDPALRIADGIVLTRDFTIDNVVNVKVCNAFLSTQTPQCCPEGNWVCPTDTPNGLRYRCGGTLLENVDGAHCEEKCCENVDKEYCDQPIDPSSTGAFAPIACCPNGTWACPNYPVTVPLTYTCGDRIINEPEGEACEDCCLRETEPACPLGQPSLNDVPGCCPDGRWMCRPALSSAYGCHSTETVEGVIGVEQPDGDVCGEPPYMYKLPEWWDRIKKDHEGPRLRRCYKRQHPPKSGLGCSRFPKTCYWGNQICPDATTPGATFPYPSVKSTCDGDKWFSEFFPCP